MVMTSEQSTRLKMAQLRLACEQEIRACCERSGLLATSIREPIKSIKPLVENAETNRGKLAKLKDYLKEMESTFHEALKANASKEAKHASTSEAISAMAVRIEYLKKTVDDQRAKKDEYEAVLSQQLLALQKIEEENEGDVIEIKKLKEATDWYRSVLGFQSEGGEGVKFIFNKIDRNDQDKEYWFVVRLDGDIYTCKYNIHGFIHNASVQPLLCVSLMHSICLMIVLHCNPELHDIDDLIEELNRTNGLFKFVRVMREKFQEISCEASSLDSGTHSIAVSSPPPKSSDSQMEAFIQTNPSLQSKKNQAGSLHKVVPSPAAILTPQSFSVRRRSPRFPSILRLVDVQVTLSQHCVCNVSFSSRLVELSVKGKRSTLTKLNLLISEATMNPKDGEKDYG
ncbi:hypothetical protein IEQ34_019028 [Dendrobium chrysotoxum]|uniref:Kinetochore protein SPC25 n=1 Tax=Dendrobium chrysotoxum TaxID=161865 RepID=A0AAV7G7R0_DENCH|nr:hypothetical protein IEQ34_019028 [Dendrobium chrysotoxum]